MYSINDAQSVFVLGREGAACSCEGLCHTRVWSVSCGQRFTFFLVKKKRKKIITLFQMISIIEYF